MTNLNLKNVNGDGDGDQACFFSLKFWFSHSLLSFRSSTSSHIHMWEEREGRGGGDEERMIEDVHVNKNPK